MRSDLLVPRPRAGGQRRICTCVFTLLLSSSFSLLFPPPPLSSLPPRPGPQSMEKHIQVAIDEQSAARTAAVRRIEEQLKRIDTKLLGVAERADTSSHGDVDAVLEQRMSLLRQALQSQVETVQSRWATVHAESAAARRALQRDVSDLRSTLDEHTVRSAAAPSSRAALPRSPPRSPSPAAAAAATRRPRAAAAAALSTAQNRAAELLATPVSERGTVAERRQRLHELYRELSVLEQLEAERFLSVS